MSTDKVVTTLTLKYRQHWGLKEAIREIVSNSLDSTKRMPRIRGFENAITIDDDGEGLTKRQFLLLGISEKRGADNIGQFGEGIKIACVVLKRSGYGIRVRSQDWNCEISTEQVEGEPVIAYLFGTNMIPIKGVEVTISGIKQSDVEEIVNNMFLPDNVEMLVKHDFYGEILKDEKYKGKIYCKRVFVSNTPKTALYGYDLKNVSMNTDRGYASPFDIKYHVGGLLSRITDEEEIERILWSWQQDYFESDVSNLNLNEHFKRAFVRKYGANAVIDTDSQLRGKVAYNGGELVRMENEEICSALSDLGILVAEMFIQEKSKQKAEVKAKLFDGIDDKKKRNVKIAFGIVQQMGMFETTFKELVENNRLFFYSRNKEVTSKAFTGAGKVYISLDEIHDPVQVTRSVIHELIHMEYGADDLSAEFQQLMGTAIEKLTTLAFHYLSEKTLIDSV